MSKVQARPQSAEEKALLRTQTDLLRENQSLLRNAQREANLINKIFLEQQGFRVTQDKFGNITSITETKRNIRRRNEQAEIERLFNDRTRAALKGELPVSEGLLSDIERRRAEIFERGRRSLGAGFESSTPFQQELARFETDTQTVLDAARRGDLSVAEQLGLARQLGNQQSLGIGQQQGSQATFGTDLAIGGAFGNLASRFDPVLGRFQQDRQFADQLAASQSGPGGFFGKLTGLGLGSLAIGLGSSPFKD